MAQQLVTDHKYEIDILRSVHTVQAGLAADMLELHDKTGISLDNWENARQDPDHPERSLICPVPAVTTVSDRSCSTSS